MAYLVHPPPFPGVETGLGGEVEYSKVTVRSPWPPRKELEVEKMFADYETALNFRALLGGWTDVI